MAGPYQRKEIVWASTVAAHVKCEREGYLRNAYGRLEYTVGQLNSTLPHTVFENLIEYLIDETKKENSILNTKIGIHNRTIESIDSTIDSSKKDIDEATMRESKGGFITADHYFNREEVKQNIIFNVKRAIGKLDALISTWKKYDVVLLREEKLTKNDKSMEFQSDSNLGIGARNDFVIFYKHKNTHIFNATIIEVKPAIRYKVDVKGKEVYSPEIMQGTIGQLVIKKHIDSLAKMAGIDGGYQIDDSMFFFEYRKGEMPIVEVDADMRSQALRRASMLRGYSTETGRHPTREDWHDEERCPGCWFNKLCKKEDELEKKLLKDKQA